MFSSGLALGILLSFSPYLGSIETSASSYVNGQQICGLFPSLVSQENGAFFEVPLDHHQPAGRKLRLYYRFEVPFKAELPTVVIFNGGPGQGSHFGFLGDLEGFNVLLFDPRGVSCSRPETYEDYLNASHYSSKAIAQDMELLRKHLGIQQWSIYGVSYGTVPATIYASLFPQATRVLALEGVVYEGGDELWSGAFRRRVLDRHLAQLPAQSLENVLGLAQNYDLHPSWLSLFARYVLTLDGGEQTLFQRLEACNSVKGCEELVQEFRKLFTEQKSHPLYSMDQYIHSAIACQELGFDSATLTLYDELKSDGSFAPISGATKKVFCENLKNSRPGKLFKAANYPVKVPVVYFQGLSDGVTQSSQAFLHYQEVAQNRAALFLSSQGGHSPNLGQIIKGDVVQRSLFLSALRGELPSNTTRASEASGPWIIKTK